MKKKFFFILPSWLCFFFVFVFVFVVVFCVYCPSISMDDDDDYATIMSVYNNKKNPSIHASSSFHCDDNDDDDDFISCQRYTGVCVYKCARLICLFIQQLFVGVTRIYRYLNGWILDQSIRNFFIFIVVVSFWNGFILVFNRMVDWLFVCFIDLFFFAIFLLVVYWCVYLSIFHDDDDDDDE